MTRVNPKDSGKLSKQAREIRRQAEALARQCKKLETERMPGHAEVEVVGLAFTAFYALEARIRAWDIIIQEHFS